MKTISVTVNGQQRDVPSRTVADLAAALDPAPATLLIEHNGRALLRHEWPGIRLAPGDRLEVLKISAGG